jgi:Tfp pilus assembly protein PilX
MKNQKGIALIVALIIAFIILALGGMALYVSMQSTKISGGFKQYRSSIEAASGAFNETNRILEGIKSGTTVSLPNTLIDNKTSCLYYKLNNPTTSWTNDDLSNDNCFSTTDKAKSTNIDDIKNYYDLKYSLGNYIVYIKVSGTAEGNTSSSSNNGLTAGGVTSNKQGTNIVHPPTIPYLYRIEIVSESKLNSNDKAHISLLYGY